MARHHGVFETLAHGATGKRSCGMDLGSSAARFVKASIDTSGRVTYSEVDNYSCAPSTGAVRGCEIAEMATDVYVTILDKKILVGYERPGGLCDKDWVFAPGLKAFLTGSDERGMLTRFVEHLKQVGVKPMTVVDKFLRSFLDRAWSSCNAGDRDLDSSNIMLAIPDTQMTDEAQQLYARVCEKMMGRSVSLITEVECLVQFALHNNPDLQTLLVDAGEKGINLVGAELGGAIAAFYVVHVVLMKVADILYIVIRDYGLGRTVEAGLEHLRYEFIRAHGPKEAAVLIQQVVNRQQSDDDITTMGGKTYSINEVESKISNVMSPGINAFQKVLNEAEEQNIRGVITVLHGGSLRDRDTRKRYLKKIGDHQVCKAVDANAKPRERYLILEERNLTAKGAALAGLEHRSDQDNKRILEELEFGIVISRVNYKTANNKAISHYFKDALASEYLKLKEPGEPFMDLKQDNCPFPVDLSPRETSVEKLAEVFKNMFMRTIHTTPENVGKTEHVVAPMTAARTSTQVPLEVEHSFAKPDKMMIKKKTASPGAIETDKLNLQIRPEQAKRLAEQAIDLSCKRVWLWLGIKTNNLSGGRLGFTITTYAKFPESKYRWTEIGILVTQVVCCLGSWRVNIIELENGNKTTAEEGKLKAHTVGKHTAATSDTSSMQASQPPESQAQRQNKIPGAKPGQARNRPKAVATYGKSRKKLTTVRAPTGGKPVSNKESDAQSPAKSATRNPATNRASMNDQQPGDAIVVDSSSSSSSSSNSEPPESDHTHAIGPSETASITRLRPATSKYEHHSNGSDDGQESPRVEPTDQAYQNIAPEDELNNDEINPVSPQNTRNALVESARAPEGMSLRQRRSRSSLTSQTERPNQGVERGQKHKLDDEEERLARGKRQKVHYTATNRGMVSPVSLYSGTSFDGDNAEAERTMRQSSAGHRPNRHRKWKQAYEQMNVKLARAKDEADEALWNSSAHSSARSNKARPEQPSGDSLQHSQFATSTQFAIGGSGIGRISTKEMAAAKPTITATDVAQPSATHEQDCESARIDNAHPIDASSYGVQQGPTVEYFGLGRAVEPFTAHVLPDLPIDSFQGDLQSIDEIPGFDFDLEYFGIFSDNPT